MNIRILALIPILFLTSCARRVSVNNNSFVDPQALPSGFLTGSAFFIAPTKDLHELFGKEVTHKIKTLLAERGFAVTSADQAQYQITANLTMTPTTIKVRVPVYTPGETITVQGCKHTDDNNQVYEETRKTAGSMDYVTEERTMFDHHLQLNVYAIQRTKDATQKELVWQGAASVRSDESDQRDILDYLLVSAFNYFGKNTKKHVVTSVSDSNRTMKKLRKF